VRAWPAWTGWLWPRPVARRAWRRNVVAVVRVRAGRVRFAWAVPLFVVEDLLEGAALYGVWLGPWGRRAAGILVPAWRQLRWCGPARLLDIRSSRLLLQLRLI
jgi:hypothetical protein